MPGDRRRERWIAAFLAASIFADVALVVVFAFGGQPQWEGTLLFVALASLAVGLVLWAHGMLPDDEEVEPRPVLAGAAADRDAVAAELDRGDVLHRRPLVRRMFLGAVAGLGAAAVFPLRSIVPTIGSSLRHTPWRPGMRLVDRAGRPIRARDVPTDSMLTAFPEGHPDAADGVAVLIRVTDDVADAAGADDGFLAFSKVCTHAGCPVGLYLAQTRTLLCPCHQSAFDVLRGAKPVSGPAARRLPRLPLHVDHDGMLIATDDFDSPVGPAWWTM